MKTKKLPQNLKSFFWDSNFEDLDIYTHRIYIISRLYVYGDLYEIKWIHQTYTDDEIKETALKSRNLDPIVANYLMQKYKLNRNDMAYYRNIDDYGYEYRR